MEEIERKFLVTKLPNLETTAFIKIEQGYLNTENDPIIRIRNYNNDFYLTYKKNISEISCEEYELPLSKEVYEHLVNKIDNNLIKKRRYLIDLENNLTAELDIFDEHLKGLILVEVEFKDIEQANNFKKPDWFGNDVTNRKEYRNSELSKMNLPKKI